MCRIDVMQPFFTYYKSKLYIIKFCEGLHICIYVPMNLSYFAFADSADTLCVSESVI